MIEINFTFTTIAEATAFLAGRDAQPTAVAPVSDAERIATSAVATSAVASSPKRGPGRPAKASASVAPAETASVVAESAPAEEAPELVPMEPAPEVLTDLDIQARAASEEYAADVAKKLAADEAKKLADIVTRATAAPAAPAPLVYATSDLPARISEMVAKGRIPEIKVLLTQFGAKKGPEIKPEDLAAFGTALAALEADVA